MFKKTIILGLAVMVSGMFVSCAKKQIVKAEPETEFTSQAEEPDIKGKDFQKVTDVKVINFDYDKSDIRTDARAILKANADYLKKFPQLDALVEGHCDERGSLEYNMALGQRRATAVRSYYIQLGVSADRISTISYGKERPVDNNHDEAAWAKNRRGETLVRKKSE